MTNLLRARLREGVTTYGLWVTLESATVTEIAADLGLDWVCVDTEHGHLDYKEVLDHLRAARGSQTTVVVRVPDNAQHLIKRVLDLGVYGILVPMVRSRADLDTALGWARYPLAGRRGVGGERAVRWGLRFEEYLGEANDEVLVIPILETADAIAAAEDILEAPGLEAIFLGPADLSSSLGYLGAWEGPGVAEHLATVKDRAASRGIATGILSRGHADLQRRRDQGFRMIGIGSDTGLLVEGIRRALGAANEANGA